MYILLTICLLNVKSKITNTSDYNIGFIYKYKTKVAIVYKSMSPFQLFDVNHFDINKLDTLNSTIAFQIV